MNRSMQSCVYCTIEKSDSYRLEACAEIRRLRYIEKRLDIEMRKKSKSSMKRLSVEMQRSDGEKLGTNMK